MFIYVFINMSMMRKIPKTFNFTIYQKLNISTSGDVKLMSPLACRFIRFSHILRGWGLGVGCQCFEVPLNLHLNFYAHFPRNLSITSLEPQIYQIFDP